MESHFDIDRARLAALCARWKIAELSLFGSALRDDFTAESDIDVMVAFDPAESWTFGEILQLRDELAELFGRPVDLVERKAVLALSNPFRRRHILAEARELYVA